MAFWRWWLVAGLIVAAARWAPAAEPVDYVDDRESEVLDANVNYRDVFRAYRNPLVPLGKLVPVGERLVYQAQWKGVPAGTITLEATGVKKIGRDNKVLCLQMKCASNNILSLVYPVRTEAISYPDVETGQSYLLRREVEEGRRKYSDRLMFDYDSRLNSSSGPMSKYDRSPDDPRVVKDPSLVRPIPDNVQDTLSIVYYVRGLDFSNPELPPQILVGGRGGTTLATIRMVGEERLTVPGVGEFDCLIVEPTGDGGKTATLVSTKGSARLWLEKTTKIPLKLAVEAPFGQVSAILTEATGSNLPAKTAK